jgi:hypothetical protein
MDRTNPANFYQEWLVRAFRAALVVAGVDWKRDMMSRILLWAIACLILYFVLWKYFLLVSVEAEDVSHEVRFGLSAVFAILVAFLIGFVYQLLKQPRVMYDEVTRRLAKAEGMLSEIDNVERDKVVLSQLHKEGLGLYHSFVSPDDPDAASKWIVNMDGWLENVRNHLRERWSVSTLHEFNDPSGRGGFSYKRRDDRLNGIKNEHGGALTALYSGYIYSLDQIIRFNGGDHFGQRRLLEDSLRGERYNSAIPNAAAHGIPEGNIK